MPEFPEMFTFASDMRRELVGKTISGIEVLQPKSLNLSESGFRAALIGARLLAVSPRGKWLQVETTQGWLLLNLGMGGEILLADRGNLPDRYRVIFDLAEGAALVVNFWWFGHAHYAPVLADHGMTARLGPNVMDLSLAEFHGLLRGRRGAIKPFLLNQVHLAGIGNVYVQDPLFKAGLHPLRRIDTLRDEEIESLHHAIHDILQESIDHGGAAFELNLYGEYGGWDTSFLLVAYKEGKPCPSCGTTVQKIRTGSTSTHICPCCQPLI